MLFFRKKKTNNEELLQLLHRLESLEGLINQLHRQLKQQNQNIVVERTMLSNCQNQLLQSMEHIDNHITTLHDSLTTPTLQTTQSDASLNVDELIKSYALRIQKYETDLYHKILSPLLRDIIRVADRLELLEKRCGIDTATATLIKHEREAVVSILHNYNTDRLRSEQGTKFNPEIHEAVGTIPTNDKALDETIVESVRSGYIWTIPFIPKVVYNPETPHKISTVLREEQIIIYVYKEL